MSPTLANGKICYLELPTSDPERSAAFYSTVFGWRMRKRGDGSTAFDDTTGEVSGAFVANRTASDRPGLLVYIMVNDLARTCELIAVRGGAVVQRAGAGEAQATARFRDPDGNVLGLYEHPAPAHG